MNHNPTPPADPARFTLPGATGDVSASSQSDVALETAPQAVQKPALNEETAYHAAVAAIGHSLDPGKRTMDRCVDGSGQIFTSWPGYENLPVKRCIYLRQDPGDTSASKALAYVLHPSKDQLAHAIAVACTRGKLGDPARCATQLFKKIFGANNAMYPVAGYVLERDGEAGCDGTAMRAIYFRDGIAATLPDRQFCQPLPDIATSEADAKRDDYDFAFESRLSTLHPSGFIQPVPRTNVWHTHEMQYRPTHAWGEMARKDHIRLMTGGPSCFLHLAAARLMNGTPDVTLCEGL